LGLYIGFSVHSQQLRRGRGQGASFWAVRKLLENFLPAKFWAENFQVGEI